MVKTTNPVCAALNIAAAMAFLLMAAALHSPQPNDAKGLAKCLQLHPDRYCRLAYFPSSLKH